MVLRLRLASQTVYVATVFTPRPGLLYVIGALSTELKRGHDTAGKKKKPLEKTRLLVIIL